MCMLSAWNYGIIEGGLWSFWGGGMLWFMGFEVGAFLRLADDVGVLGCWGGYGWN